MNKRVAVVYDTDLIYYTGVPIMLGVSKWFTRESDGAILQISGRDVGVGFTMNDINKVINTLSDHTIHRCELLQPLSKLAMSWLRDSRDAHRDNSGIGLMFAKKSQDIISLYPSTRQTVGYDALKAGDKPSTIADIIQRIDTLDQYEHGVDIGRTARCAGVYIIAIGPRAAMYGCVRDLGAFMLEKIREYRTSGIDPTVLLMQTYNTQADAENVIARIDTFVAQHEIGFTDPVHGKFMNTCQWKEKLEVISRYL